MCFNAFNQQRQAYDSSGQVCLHIPEQALFNRAIKSFPRLTGLCQMETTSIFASFVYTSILSLPASKIEKIFGTMLCGTVWLFAEKEVSDSDGCLFDFGSLERALTRLRDNDSRKAHPVTKDYKVLVALLVTLFSFGVCQFWIEHSRVACEILP